MKKLHRSFSQIADLEQEADELDMNYASLVKRVSNILVNSDAEDASMQRTLSEIKGKEESREHTLEIIIGEHKALMIDMFDTYLNKYKSRCDNKDIQI